MTQTSPTAAAAAATNFQPPAAHLQPSATQLQASATKGTNVQPSAAPTLGSILPWRTLVLNIVAPLVTYQLATSHGATETQALLLAAVFPLASIAFGAVRTRALDPIGAISLVAIVLSGVATLFFSDPRILLAKDSLVTATIGLAFLASLLAPRPLIFILGRRFAATDPARSQRFDDLWQSPRARASLRLTTLVWGAGLLAEALIRAACALLLPAQVVLAISPLLSIGTIALLGLWTFRRYRGRF